MTLLPTDRKIRSHRWRDLNRFLSDLHALRRIEDFFPFCLEGFPRLLDCPYLAWDEFDPSLQLAGFKATSAYKADLERVFPDIVETIGSHPIVTALDVLRNPRRFYSVYAITDFATDREFRETPLYREAYRHVEAEYQLYTDIFFSSEHHAGISINSPKPFSAEQRAIAEIASRHIEVAYSRILALREVRESDGNSANLTLGGRGEANAVATELSNELDPEMRKALALRSKGLPDGWVGRETGFSGAALQDLVRGVREWTNRLLR